MTRSTVFLCLLPFALPLLSAPVLAADTAPGVSPGAVSPGVAIDLRAVEELAGPDVAARVDASLRTPPAGKAEKSAADSRPLDAAAPVPSQGDALQILYARGNLVISPSAKETLDDWAANFLKADSKVEILSYSGTTAPAWVKDKSAAEGQSNDIMTYSLHEAIRTAFKRALVVRDILVARGVPEGNITVRAIGPTGDQGPAERIDVIALRG